MVEAAGNAGPAAGQVTNGVIAGLGGQGVLKASDILAEAAFLAGLDVKKAEVHGMSQRGGSVSSDVRFGAKVLSPMVPPGQADYLVVLEADQVDNNRWQLRAGGVLLGPDCIDMDKLANKRSINVAMLGALSRHLGIPRAEWMAAVKASLPPKLHEANEQAFAVGESAALTGI
jgi:indolepyruvate ferredoxin oxidoreductase beta subunit